MFWLNGDYQEAEEKIAINDRGLLLGDGIFETLLVQEGAPAFLDAHLQRLGKGAATLQIPFAPSENLGRVIHTLHEKNNPGERASARITLTRGPGARGVLFPNTADIRPTLLITMSAAPALCEEPAKLMVSDYARAEQSVSARCKTLNYVDNVLARNQAAASGADEAIMVNGRGRIACASTANLFVIDVEAGALVTPPAREGALPGIVRGLLLDGAAGVCIREEPIEVAMLQDAQIVLTNSLIGLRGANLGENKPWPAPAMEILRRLQSWYEGRLNADLAQRALLL